jgi:dTDP-4-dehydrorhamnose 3,5-epimerase
MIIEQTSISGIRVIKPEVFGDERGFFMEAYEARKFASAGINDNFVQDNHSGSNKGTLRGLHYQIRQVQAKLVRVVVGEVYDVAVDLRRRSPTFGKWIGLHLSAENKMQLFIPKGFAHGYYVLSDWAEVLYKAGDFYAKQWDRSILWNDPQLNIKWPLVNGEAPTLSAKDQAGKALAEAEVFEDLA